jgi:phage terminase large subunit
MPRPIGNARGDGGVVNTSLNLSPKMILALTMLEDTSPEAPTIIGWGGARGAAKSHAARTLAILRRDLHPGTSACIFRRTYPDLLENHILPIQQEWPDLFSRCWSAESRALLYPDGGAIYFRYADTFQDILDQRGREYGDLFVDEATDSEERALRAFYATARSKVPGFVPKKFLTFNPGGVSMGYIKRLFIDKEWEPAEEQMHPAFIQAYAWDNHIWSQDALAADGFTAHQYHEWPEDKRREYFLARAPYAKELLGQVDYLRDAWLWGKWDVFAGQFFTCWDREKNTFNPRKVKIAPWWKKWISIDWGFRHPTAVYWHASDDDGTIYTYREHVMAGRTPEELANDIVMLTRGFRGNGLDFEEIDAVYLSPDAFGMRQSERTIADEIGDVFDGEGIPRPEKADNDRKGGAALLFQLLLNRQAFVSEDCPSLIKCIPMMVHDEKGSGDIKKVDAVDGKGGDDSYDAWRYGLKTRLQVATKSTDVLMAERAKAAGLDWRQDLTGWAIQSGKLRAEIEREQVGFVSLRGGRSGFREGMVQ